MMMGGGEYQVVRGANKKVGKTYTMNTKWKVF